MVRRCGSGCHSSGEARHLVEEVEEEGNGCQIATPYVVTDGRAGEEREDRLGPRAYRHIPHGLAGGEISVATARALNLGI